MGRSARQPSDTKRAFTEDGPQKTHIGGQALIEGVMMRGYNSWALAVLMPNGAIHQERHELDPNKRRGWKSWPIIRGCFALVDSLVLGFKALEIAADYSFDDEEATDAPCVAPLEPSETTRETKRGDSCFEDNALTQASSSPAVGASAGASVSCTCAEAPTPEEPEHTAGENFTHFDMVISMVLGLVLALVLFMFAPAAIAQLLVGNYGSDSFAWNLVDGVARAGVFVFYVWLIGRMKDIKRMFAFHGAEHKTIHCYEHGLDLTPENARQFPRLHVRCGTAFLMMTIIVALILYTIIPFDIFVNALGVQEGVSEFIVIVVLRILFLPLIAGITYEITVKWAGNHPDSRVVKVLLWPGLQMQRLTTNEPDDEQLTCAILAMQQVLEREELGN